MDDALRRIEGVYKPYHRALRRLFTAMHARFGVAVLVDCHSMPSTAGATDERPRPTSCWATATAPAASAAVIGDRRQRRCAAMGYTVSRNKPYAGGFITEHYGNPAAGLHAIQIEINRGLYMDERRYERSHGFGELAADLEIAGGLSLGDNPARGAAALSGRRRIGLITVAAGRREFQKKGRSRLQAAQV